MPGIKRKRCSEEYGAKSLRIMRTAIQRGMYVREDGKLILPTGKVHNGTPQWGRDRVNLSIDGERIIIQTARIICYLAYGEPPNVSDIVDHINGNTLDDSPQNLRWSTHSENRRNTSMSRKINKCYCACAGINPEAVPDMKKALYFLGGGDIYLEEFGRLCFCSGCRIGEKGPINKGIHSSACDDAWEAYAKAEGKS